MFPIFEAWYRESLRIRLFSPPKNTVPLHQTSAQRKRVTKTSGSSNCDPTACWFWDGMEHVDPVKEAKAAVTRVNGNISNLAIECAKNGLDWEDVLIQKAREKKRMIELGLSDADFDPDNNETDNEEDDEENDPDESDAAPEPDQARRKRKRREDS